MNTPSTKKTMLWRGGLVALDGGRDKTRIGTGDDLAEVIASARAAAENEPAESKVAVPVAPDSRSSPSELGMSSEVSPSSEPVAAPSPAALEAAKPPAVTMASTRIMPIESLFPGAAKAAIESDRSGQDDAVIPVLTPSLGERLQSTIAPVRNLIMRDPKRAALYGGGAALMLLVALWPAPPRGVPSRVPAIPVASSAQEAAAKAIEDKPAAESEAPASTSVVGSEGLERAAVDALASGDLERAQRLYKQLAEQVPRPSPFSEAARILARSASGEPR